MAKKTKEQLKAGYEKAKKAGKVKEAGVGTVLSSAAKLAIKAAKAAKSAKAAKAAAKTTKNIPKGPTVKNPPKPLMGKSPNLKNPPKPPTSSSVPKKEPFVAEGRTSSYKLPEVPKQGPKKTVRPKQFSGDMARYNWTGK